MGQDTRGVGTLIRDLRAAHGWSQATLADRLCQQAGTATVTRHDVSRWESPSNTRCPSPFWLRHLAAVLEVPFALLEAESVDRRSFLSTLAATSIAPLVSADLIERGFTAALHDDRPSLDEWEQRTEQYGTAYMSAGAAEIQQRLAGDLLVLQQQLESPGAWAVAAKLMTLFGKTIPGTDGAKAIQWYRMAATAADRSGDPDIRVWVRGRAAIALGYEGAALPIAETFAAQARGISDRPSLGLLNATWGGAHASAIRGDHATARRLMTEGRRLHDAVGSHEQTSDYAVPEWRMNVFASLLAARLGDEATAIAAQDTAAAILPASLPRFRTHLELHRGLMLARAGDRGGGVQYAQTALDRLPPEKHSLTLRLLLDEVRATT